MYGFSRHYCDLIAQDESIAVGLWDFTPPHQDAAGGGGEGRHIGGTTGGHYIRRQSLEHLKYTYGILR